MLALVFSAGLTGAAMLHQVKGWGLDIPDRTNQGHAFIVINVDAIMPIQVFKERVDWLIRQIKGSPKAKGSERIYLPGEMEWEKRETALKDGMQLPVDVMASLAGLAEDVGLDLKRLWVGA